MTTKAAGRAYETYEEVLCLLRSSCQSTLHNEELFAEYSTYLQSVVDRFVPELRISQPCMPATELGLLVVARVELVTSPKKITDLRKILDRILSIMEAPQALKVSCLSLLARVATYHLCFVTSSKHFVPCLVLLGGTTYEELTSDLLQHPLAPTFVDYEGASHLNQLVQKLDQLHGLTGHA